MTYVQLEDGHVVDVDPNWAPPVVLLGSVELALLAQALQAMRAEELLLITQKIQELPELWVIGLHEADEEREERDVALVTNQSILLKGIDGRVAIAALLLRPVEVVQVVLHALQVRAVLVRVLRQAERVGNVGERLGQQSHPREQVDMQLAWVRRLRPRVVVEAAGEAVCLGATAPAVRLLGREGSTLVRLDVSVLRLAEPAVLAAQ